MFKTFLGMTVKGNTQIYQRGTDGQPSRTEPIHFYPANLFSNAEMKAADDSNVTCLRALSEGASALM
jgi:hypothetical protein